MEDLREYRCPLFVDLRGRGAVIVGAGPIALRRAGVLLSFGAEVILIAPECEAPPPGAVWERRTYRDGDLENAFLAVAATNNREVNRLVGREAARRNIPVSVADAREESTFFFPAVCTGGGLVSGVVSRGDNHKKTAAAARAIRAVLEELP